MRAYCFCHLNLTPWLCVLVQKIGASESTAAALSALMPLAGEGSSVLLASYIVSRHMPWRHVLSAGVPSTLLTGWGIDKLPHRWRGFVLPAWISLLVLGTLIMAADSRPRCDLLPPPLTCYLPAHHGDSSFCLCACSIGVAGFCLFIVGLGLLGPYTLLSGAFALEIGGQESTCDSCAVRCVMEVSGVHARLPQVPGFVALLLMLAAT